MNISVASLTTICTKILRAVGASDEESRLISSQLIEANLRGQEGHGVTSIPALVKSVKEGRMRFGVEVKMVMEAPSSAIIDGNGSSGHIVTNRAMKLAIEKAKKHTVSIVGVRNVRDIGILANYPVMALEDDMIGVILCNSFPQVAPYGGRIRLLGTNAICIAIPSKSEQPIVLDMATSVIAARRLRSMYRAGERKIPEGLIIDSEGRPTTDLEDFFTGGALLPFGGYKGSGLSIVIELLAGVLTGTGCSLTDPHFQQNGVLISVLNVGSFLPIDEFKEKVDYAIRSLKSTPKAQGFKEIILPGELSYRSSMKMRKEGIDLDDETWLNLKSIEKELNLEGENP
ncbi:MAG: Ldh family oxidoreductase [Candidatus Bathyarchaeota archaeon]